LRRICLLRVLCSALLAGVATTNAGAVPIESGHSAIWYDPARDGEGWVVEVLDDARVALTWFTYDESGGQRWLFGVGEIVDEGGDQRVLFAQLYAPRGARFGAAFDPAAVEYPVAGEATLSFSDCQRGEFSHTAFGQAQSVPLQRLSHTMAAGCAPRLGRVGDALQAYAGQSGSWFDPAHDGEGFQLQWSTRDQALLTWYSYDADGNPFWMTGVGQYEDGRIEFPMLHSTRGGRFGAAHDPTAVERIEWGSLTLDIDCDRGTASYESPVAGFGSGVLELVRLTQLRRLACPWQRPALTDLFDIELIELPVEPATPPPDTIVSLGSGNLIQAQSVADDGTVAAARRLFRDIAGAPSYYYLPARLRPGAAHWENDSTVPAQRPMLIAADGGTVLTGAERGATATYVIHEPVFLRDGSETPLSGQIFDTTSQPTGASADLRHVVGEGRRPAPSGSGGVRRPWIWNADEGQVELPLGQFGSPYAFAVSADGRVVTGGLPVLWGSSPGIRWLDRQTPELLRDAAGRQLGLAAAIADDGTLFGNLGWRNGEGPMAPAFDLRQEAWYWRDGSDNGYLGLLRDSETAPGGWWYGLTDAAADGGLAVGHFRSPDMHRSLPNGRDASGALIWSAVTGFVLVQDLLDAIGSPLDWPSMRAVDVSANGRYILLSSGEIAERAGPGSPTSERTAVLRLVARPQ
jgi:hypothetical protein